VDIAKKVRGACRGYGLRRGAGCHVVLEGLLMGEGGIDEVGRGDVDMSGSHGGGQECC